MSWFFVAVDLGKRRDPTAIAVVERAELAGDWDAFQAAYRWMVEYRVRHLERMRLGTPYPEVVERVKEVVGWGELAGRVTLIVDATGVGTPVVDMLKRAGLGCLMCPVLITGGELQRREQGYFMVPKRDLMAGLAMRLERRQLKIAAGMKDGEQLMREMAGMRVRVTASGREEYGARRADEHDDLVVAVALACWGGGKYHPGDGGAGGGYVQREGVESWERGVRKEVGRLV